MHNTGSRDSEIGILITAADGEGSNPVRQFRERLCRIHLGLNPTVKLPPECKLLALWQEIGERNSRAYRSAFSWLPHNEHARVEPYRRARAAADSSKAWSLDEQVGKCICRNNCPGSRVH